MSHTVQLAVAGLPGVRRFGALLQRGVTLHVQTECSVRTFLTDQLGIDPHYVENRITTVFLDGQVVDSLDDAVIRNGSTLALSAAMPGLAGATLRRAGPYSAMRAAITRVADGRRSPAMACATGMLRVKLFNLLIEEVGAAILAHGIVLERGDAIEVLGGSNVSLDEVPPGELVELRVQFSETPHGPAHR